MSLIENVIRPEILALSAYHVPHSDGFVKLDAMENPYLLPEDLRQQLGARLAQVAMNRYPVPSYATLKQRICEHLGVPHGFDVVLGNGSDELIAMLSVACAKPGAKVLAPTPGFVMYEMSAKFAGLGFVGVPLRADFSLDIDAMLQAIAEHRPAIVYLAYPNNPTGNLFAEADMLRIIDAVGDSAIVVADEAYQPFAQASFMPRLPQFPNLAGIRLGYLSASPELLAQLEKVRPPYNINVLTQAAAEFVLEHSAVLERQAAILREQRSALSAALGKLAGVEVFPSAANFLLVRLDSPAANADDVFSRLVSRKVLIKNVGKMHPLLRNCLRITVSTPEENALFLDAFRASLAQ